MSKKGVNSRAECNDLAEPNTVPNPACVRKGDLLLLEGAFFDCPGIPPEKDKDLCDPLVVCVGPKRRRET